MLKKIWDWIVYPGKPYKPNHVRPFVWVLAFFLLLFGLVMWHYGSMERQGTEGLQVDWATGLEISWKRIDLTPEQLEQIKALIMSAEHNNSVPVSGSHSGGSRSFVLTGGGQSRSFTIHRDILGFEYPEGELAHSFAVAPELEELINQLFAESFHDK